MKPASSPSSFTRSRLPAVVGTTCLITATGLSLYLARQSILSASIAGCSEHGTCQDVLSSPWSVLAGFPVSLLGAALYIGLLLASYQPGSNWRRVETMGIITVVVGALWFTALQALVLKAFCPWCCTIHALASMGALVLWFSRPKDEARSRPSPGELPRWLEFCLPLVMVAALATIQSLTPEIERTKRIQMTNTDGGEPRQTGSQSLPRADEDGISLYEGKIRINAAELPSIGDPGAPVLAIALTDFTCPHCAELHQTLEEAEAQLAGRLGISLIPAYRQETGRELHRVMLTLWRIDRELYQEAAHALTTESLEPKPASVIAFIQSELSQPFFELAWEQAAWVEKQLQTAEALLAENDRLLEEASLPQMILGDEIVVGKPSVATLLKWAEQTPESKPRLVGGEPAARSALASNSGGTVPQLSSQSGAQIVFDQTTLDLGTPVKGEKIRGKFTYTNTGTETLRITKLKPACGCTTAQGWDKPVAPGEKGSFEVQLDTGRFFGAITKTIDVETNTVPAQQQLSLKVNVWSPVRLSTSSASFGAHVKGTPITPRRIQVTVTEKEPLAIEGVHCSNDFFRTSWEVLEEGRRYQLIVDVPELGTDIQRGEITIPLGHPKMDEITLPLYISPVEAVDVRPDALTLGANPVPQSNSFNLTVYCHDRQFPNLEVSDLIYEGPKSFEVKVDLDWKAGRRWGYVKVVFPPHYDAAEAAAADAAVTMKTNHPEFTRLRIPIQITGTRQPAKTR